MKNLVEINPLRDKKQRLIQKGIELSGQTEKGHFDYHVAGCRRSFQSRCREIRNAYLLDYDKQLAASWGVAYSTIFCQRCF